MLWYLPWSESIKKRACRYLLQRYLGNFLEEKLTLDQLSVDLYNGTGTVCDVSLDCDVSLFYYIASFPLILYDKWFGYNSVLSWNVCTHLPIKYAQYGTTRVIYEFQTKDTLDRDHISSLWLKLYGYSFLSLYS